MSSRSHTIQDQSEQSGENSRTEEEKQTSNALSPSPSPGYKRQTSSHSRHVTIMESDEGQASPGLETQNESVQGEDRGQFTGGQVGHEQMSQGRFNQHLSGNSHGSRNQWSRSSRSNSPRSRSANYRNQVKLNL